LKRRLTRFHADVYVVIFQWNYWQYYVSAYQRFRRKIRTYWERREL